MTEALEKVYKFAKDLGFNVIDSTEMEDYYKGDLDGLNIWLAKDMDDEEELFNLLHLIGHNIQWNVSALARERGSVLHKNPDDKLLKWLQVYEWEANCYALEILHQIDEDHLWEWLEAKYVEDMYFLTHFYKTGEKVKSITQLAAKYPFKKSLFPKEIPEFTPVASVNKRNDGIVIDF